MNKLGLVLIVGAIFLAPYAYALELFSLDCDGGMSFLPSYPIGGRFDFSAALGVADTFLSVYYERLKCMCSSLTKEEFNKLLHPFFGADMAFNIMRGPEADLTFPSGCSWNAFESMWMRANNFNSVKVNLTETCTYATWQNQGTCMLQSRTFSDWDATVKAGLFKCPKAPWRPAFRVICEGAGCEQAFIPCNNDNDCAGDMSCKEFTFDRNARPSAEDLLSAFKSILQADDLTSSCINTGDIIRTTVDLVRKMWKQGASSYTGTNVKICSPIELNFWTNMTFDWQSLIHYTSGQSFISASNYVSLPGYLQPWTGDLNGGGKMTTPQGVAGPKPTNAALTPGGTLLIQKTCNGEFNLLPTSFFGVSFNFGMARNMIDHYVNTMMNVLKCRFNNLGLSISEQEIKNRWGLGLDWVFFNIDSATADAAITGSNLEDYRIGMGSRIKLPSTCNYDSWIKTGACRATYTGLSNLLGVDVTANVEVKKCDASSDISITAECVGAACSLLSLQTRTCNSDADCPNSLSCKDLNPRLGSYDWVSDYIRINTTKSPACVRSSDAIHAETKKLFLSYLGVQYDGSSDNKYCMVDFDHVSSQASTWASGEAETTAPGEITLKNLLSWDGAGTTPVASGAIPVVVNVFAALIVALTIMFN